MLDNPVLHSDPLGDSTILPANFYINRNTDGDQTGAIGNATREEYSENPLRALGKDFVKLAADVTGLNSFDDAGAELGEKNRQGTLRPAEVALAVANIGLATSDGEGARGDLGRVEIHIDAAAHPEAAAHASNAVQNGVSGEGVIDRASSSARRAGNMAGVPTQKGKDRDEFPPDVINNGGNGSSVKHINPSDNRGAGASIGNQIRNLPDNTRVVIIVKDPKIKQ